MTITDDLEVKPLKTQNSIYIYFVVLFSGLYTTPVNHALGHISSINIE